MTMSSFAKRFAILALFCSAIPARAAPVVTTMYGVVEGTTHEVNGYTLDLFKGIPFAQPPIGALRYSPPKKPSSWTGPYNATYFRPSCIQDMNLLSVPGTSSEDCLYLNVFKPIVDVTSTAEPLPVFLWIYGGGYRCGSATLYDFSLMAALGQIIVVTTNYRLGSLGFLSTQSNEVPGNAGLLDQRAAMEWVQENIEQFGGDKTRVTIAGESAGASSVSFHLFSPGSRDLFLRAISESGSPTTRWAVRTREFGVSSASALSEILQCGKAPDIDIECLRGKTVEQILKADDEVYSYFIEKNDILPFTPVVDGQFLPRDPLDMLRSGDFKRADYMSGITRDEYSLLMMLPGVYEYVQTDSSGRAAVNSTAFHFIIERLLSLGAMAGLSSSNQAMLDTAVHLYTNWSNTSSDEDRLQQLILLGSDILFTCPLTLVAKSWTNTSTSQVNSKLFVYRFSHFTSMYPSWAGVPHAAELVYVLGLPLLLPRMPKGYPLSNATNLEFYEFSDDDKTVAKRVINLWAEFVRTGDPNNMKQSDNDLMWPAYTTKSPRYLDIDGKPTVMEQLRPYHCALWTELMPRLAQQCPSCNVSVQTDATPTSTTCPSYWPGSMSSKWMYGTVAAIAISAILIIARPW